MCQAHRLGDEKSAAVVSLTTELDNAVERGDTAEATLEETRLNTAELQRQSDVQVRGCRSQN